MNGPTTSGDTPGSPDLGRLLARRLVTPPSPPAAVLNLEEPHAVLMSYIETLGNAKGDATSLQLVCAIAGRTAMKLSQVQELRNAVSRRRDVLISQMNAGAVYVAPGSLLHLQQLSLQLDFNWSALRAASLANQPTLPF